jgi:hypothetical protein
MKTTIKQKIRTGIKVTALALSIGTLGTIVYGTSRAMTPIKTETKLIPACTIVATSGGEISYAKYLAPSGEIGEAIIPIGFGLESKISESLYRKHRAISATIETTTKTYKPLKYFGVKESYETIAYVKSLGGTK